MTEHVDVCALQLDRAVASSQWQLGGYVEEDWQTLSHLQSKLSAAAAAGSAFHTEYKRQGWVCQALTTAGPKTPLSARDHAAGRRWPAAPVTTQQRQPSHQCGATLTFAGAAFAPVLKYTAHQQDSKTAW